jgi:hypothetical protein
MNSRRPVNLLVRRLTHEMTKRTSILIVILSCFAWPGQAQTSVPADTVITLQRFADAFNNGTDYKLTINADGTVVFKRFANPFVDRSDPRARASEPIHAKIAVEKVAVLIAEFERIKFFSLNDRYAKTEDGCSGVWTDNGGAEVSITINGKSKTIDHYHGCREDNHGPPYPAELTKLELKIDEAINTKQWLK